MLKIFAKTAMLAAFLTVTATPVLAGGYVEIERGWGVQGRHDDDRHHGRGHGYRHDDHHGRGHWKHGKGHHYGHNFHHPRHYSRDVFIYGSNYGGYSLGRYMEPRPAPVVYVEPRVSYAAIPPASIRYNDDKYCREYQSVTTVGGVRRSSYGTACLQPDGSWKMMN